MPQFEQSIPGNSDALADWFIGGVAVGSQDLILGGTGVFSLQVYCYDPAGGSLTIETDPFGAGPFAADTILTTNIVGQSAPGAATVPNLIGPIECPGWIFRIHLFSLSAVISFWNGILIAKGH